MNNDNYYSRYMEILVRLGFDGFFSCFILFKTFDKIMEVCPHKFGYLYISYNFVYLKIRQW